MPSKMANIKRLYISTPKRISIKWIRSELNTYLQDPEIGRPVIGYIRREVIEDITFLYVAEVLCGSDAMDDLLENIQTSTTWSITLNKTSKNKTESICLELWEVPEEYGVQLMPYEYERESHRKKLMKKWARKEPEGEKIIWFHWTRAQEAKYQEHIRLMKRTSKQSITHYLMPEHFTEKTTAFIEQMREQGAGRNEQHWTWPKEELVFYREVLKTMMVYDAATE